MHRRSASYASLVVLAVVSVSSPERARADIGDVPLLGDQANLMGGAVAATIRGGAAMWYNPAGLALPAFDRASVSLSGLGYAVRWSHVPGLVQGAGTPPTSIGAQNAVVLPRVTTIVFVPKSRLRFGIGVFNPTRQDVSHQLAPSYPYASGTAFNTLAQKSERSSLHVLLSIAYVLHSKLQLGASLHFATSRYFDMVGLSSTYDDPTSSADRSFSRISQVSNFGTGVALTLGVAYAPFPWLKLGVSVRSPSMMYRERRQELTVDTTREGLGEVDVETSTMRRSRFAIDVPEPAVVRFGAAWTHDRATVELDGELVSAARSSAFRVDRGRSTNVHVGGLVQLVRRLRLGAGFFTVRGGTSRAPRALGATAVNGLGGTCGVTIFSNPPGEVQHAGHRVVFAITTALRYTHYRGNVVGAAIASPGDLTSLSLVPTAITANEIAFHIGIDAVFPQTRGPQ